MQFFFVLMDFRTGPPEDTIILQPHKAIRLVAKKGKREREKKRDLSSEHARKD